MVLGLCVSCSKCVVLCNSQHVNKINAVTNSKQRTKLAQALLEVADSRNDHNDLYECNVGDDREDVEDNLLRQLQVFHINRVEARLGTAAGGKEEGIDCFQVAEACQYAKCYERAADDVAICNSC